MEWFLSDLDNTLIYSYKRDIGREKRLVEVKDGKELSFMTTNSYELLKLVRKRYCFVPVTTRSLEQYRRISFSEQAAKEVSANSDRKDPEAVGSSPPYALVANGGILLRDGRMDENWYRESQAICAEAEGELRVGERILAEDSNVFFEIRRVDDLFVFTKSRSQEDTMNRLQEALDPQKVQVLNNGSKVYIMPKGLSKGAAVRRLRCLTDGGSILAAGDSEFDVSMLAEAEEAWIPKDLLGLYGCGIKNTTLHVIPEQRLFSDFLLEELMDRGFDIEACQ